MAGSLEPAFLFFRTQKGNCCSIDYSLILQQPLFCSEDRQMKKTGFYIIKDKFFVDMPDPYLKGNKAGNRPHYYCF